MLTELDGKAGCLCQPAREGSLRCPLIVRPNSEDVITGNLVQTLKVLNPRYWLPDLLNHALGEVRFRRQLFRQLKIELWQKQRRYPRELLSWDEGQTEVDIVITWDNPATTVFIEMKYGSPLSETTVNNNGDQWPSDQLIRNARVGLFESGWLTQEERLFKTPRRDFVLLLVTPKGGHKLVDVYRDSNSLRAAIPHGDRFSELPKSPFIGQLSYRNIIDILRNQTRWFSRPEKVLIEQLTRYLSFKLDRVPANVRDMTENQRTDSGYLCLEQPEIIE